MSEVVPIVSAALAGIFALAAGYLAWRQKRHSDDRERELSMAKERREELKRLYSDVYVLVEQRIKCIRAFEPAESGKGLSEVNSRVRLLAPEVVVERYMTVVHQLDEWAVLFFNASPRRMKVGEETMIVLQAPDPTEKYKQPEREAHEKLQDSVQSLIDAMRDDLKKDA